MVFECQNNIFKLKKKNKSKRHRIIWNLVKAESLNDSQKCHCYAKDREENLLSKESKTQNGTKKQNYKFNGSKKKPLQIFFNDSFNQQKNSF